MATSRRLSEKDVKIIFKSLEQNEYPPENLPYTIVPVSSSALKLSPPSIEFKDGLYVLLRPCKKNKHGIESAPSRIPSNLTSLVNDTLHKETRDCPWSLSGPQFPQSAVTQQRYCYPKGDPTYSKNKGGALWTVYKNDKEDLEYRLLHVYFSAKRAMNQMEKDHTKIHACTPSPYRHKRANSQTNFGRSPFSPYQSSKVSLSPAEQIPYRNHPYRRNQFAREYPSSYANTLYDHQPTHWQYDPGSHMVPSVPNAYYTPIRAPRPHNRDRKYDLTSSSNKNPYHVNPRIYSPITTNSVQEMSQSLTQENGWMLSGALEPLPFVRSEYSWDSDKTNSSAKRSSHEEGTKHVENKNNYTSVEEWGEFEDFPKEAV